jgi:hypothetical protein
MQGVVRQSDPFTYLIDYAHIPMEPNDIYINVVKWPEPLNLLYRLRDAFCLLDEVQSPNNSQK